MYVCIFYLCAVFLLFSLPHFHVFLSAEHLPTVSSLCPNCCVSKFWHTSCSWGCWAVQCGLFPPVPLRFILFQCLEFVRFALLLRRQTAAQVPNWLPLSDTRRQPFQSSEVTYSRDDLNVLNFSQGRPETGTGEEHELLSRIVLLTVLWGSLS